MVASTCGDDSSAFFLFGHIPEGCGGSSNFEASDCLEIFSLEEDICGVLGGEIGGSLKGGVGDYFFVFSVGLIDFIGRDQL